MIQCPQLDMKCHRRRHPQDIRLPGLFLILFARGLMPEARRLMNIKLLMIHPVINDNTKDYDLI